MSNIVLPPYRRLPSPVRVEGAPICKLLLFDLVELQTRSDLFVLCHHYHVIIMYHVIIILDTTPGTE